MLPEWIEDKDEANLLHDEPYIKLKTRYIFITLIYFTISAYLLFFMSLIKTHYVFNLMYAVSNTFTSLLLWAKLKRLHFQQVNNIGEPPIIL